MVEWVRENHRMLILPGMEGAPARKESVGSGPMRHVMLALEPHR